MEQRTLTWEERVKFFREISAAGDRVSVLYWKPFETKPKDGAYVLIKCIDKDGEFSCCSAKFENGEYIAICDSGVCGKIDERTFLGWDYYPYSQDDED